MPGYVFVLMPHSGARFDLFATQTGRSDHRPELVADDAAIGDYVALVSRPETPPIEGSLGFVHFGERMASIPHDAIADLRFRELDGEFNEAQQEGRVYVARWIKRGAKVEIIAGPFAGMFGSVQSVINKHTVSVWAQLFGQLSKVAMPIDHIRRLR
jgi:transcription antitermination factor NusG